MSDRSYEKRYASYNVFGHHACLLNEPISICSLCGVYRSPHHSGFSSSVDLPAALLPAYLLLSPQEEEEKTCT